MALVEYKFKPGIDKQNTEYGAEGRWVDSDNVRFRYGLPEKIGGWEKVTSDALVGATRAILSYSDLNGVKYIIYGTNKKLYAYSEGSYAEITPTRSTGTGNITQFATTNGSTTVTVTDSSHGALIGDFVIGDSMPYKYLTKSIKNFLNQKILINLMKKNGFKNCSYRNLSGGIVAIHSGWKI